MVGPFRRLRRWFFSRVEWEICRQAHLIRYDLLALEKRLMEKLDDLNTALDDISTGIDEQGKKLSEIGLDIDDLIGLAGGGDLQAVLDKANAIKAKVQATNDALAALAAKHANPSEGGEAGTTEGQ